MPTSRIRIDGPLFDGRAGAAARDYCDMAARTLAEIGQTWIKVEAHSYDKSGRGGTGAAAEGVELIGEGPGYVIRGGIRAGEYAWPWLEGTSQRNRSTGFRGYHPFRRTRLRLRRTAKEYMGELLSTYIGRMGGI